MVPYSGIASDNSAQDDAYQNKSQTSQDVIEETPRSLPLAPEEMGLIERPRMRKTFELDEEFEFGPPLQINPGQFTKQLKNPGPLYQTTQAQVPAAQTVSTDNNTRHFPFPQQDPLPGQQVEEIISNDAVSTHNRLPPVATGQPSPVMSSKHGAQNTEHPPKRTVDTQPPPKGRPFAEVSPPSTHKALEAAEPLPRPSIGIPRVKISRCFTSGPEPEDFHSQPEHRASTVKAPRHPPQQERLTPMANGEHVCRDGDKFLSPHQKGTVTDAQYHYQGRNSESRDQSSPSSMTMSNKGGQPNTDRSHYQDIPMRDYTLPGNTEAEEVAHVESRAAHTRSFDHPETRQPKSTSPYFETVHHGEVPHHSRQRSHKSHELPKMNSAGSGKPPNKGAGKIHSSSRTQRVSPIRRRAAAPATRLHRHHATKEPKPVHKQSPRPPLEGSNVSRRRTVASTATRSEIIDITSTPDSEIIRSSPTTNNKSVKISQEFTKDLAGVLNRFTTQHNSTRQELKEKYHTYIKQLKKKIKDREHEAQEYLARLEAQAGDIQELEHRNGNMSKKIEELEHSEGNMARKTEELEHCKGSMSKKIEELEHCKGEMARKIAEMEARLETTAERGSKAEDKYRKVKDHLNAAIEEQQKLYLMTKSQWEKTIKEVRETERNHGAALEAMLQKTEVIRHHMLEKVRQTVGQCRQDTSECK